MIRTIFTSDTEAVLVEQEGPWRVYPHGLAVDAWYVPSWGEAARWICRSLGKPGSMKRVEVAE